MANHEPEWHNGGGGCGLGGGGFRDGGHGGSLSDGGGLSGGDGLSGGAGLGGNTGGGLGCGGGGGLDDLQEGFSPEYSDFSFPFFEVCVLLLQNIIMAKPDPVSPQLFNRPQTKNSSPLHLFNLPKIKKRFFNFY